MARLRELIQRCSQNAGSRNLAYAFFGLSVCGGKDTQVEEVATKDRVAVSTLPLCPTKMYYDTKGKKEERRERTMTGMTMTIALLFALFRQLIFGASNVTLLI